jgi:hypothetical protein
MKANRHTYPYIAAWGQLLHSSSCFVADEIERAVRDRAPKDALAKRQDGTWLRYRDLDDANTRRLVKTNVEALQR